MRSATIAGVMLLVMLAEPAQGRTVLELGRFSMGDARHRCAVVHGAFFYHGHENYGCDFAKGIVQCGEHGHCRGYPHERRKFMRRAPVPAPQPQEQYDDWNYPGGVW